MKPICLRAFTVLAIGSALLSVSSASARLALPISMNFTSPGQQVYLSCGSYRCEVNEAENARYDMPFDGYSYQIASRGNTSFSFQVVTPVPPDLAISASGSHTVVEMEDSPKEYFLAFSLGEDRNNETNIQEKDDARRISRVPRRLSKAQLETALECWSADDSRAPLTVVHYHPGAVPPDAKIISNTGIGYDDFPGDKPGHSYFFPDIATSLQS